MFHSDTLQHVEDVLTLEQLFARAHLNDRHTRVIRSYFGLDRNPLLIREIAAELGLSRARVQQMAHKALRKLRKAARIPGLDHYGYLPGEYRYDPARPNDASRPPQPPQIAPQTPQTPQPQYQPGTVALDCDACGKQFVSTMHHRGGPIAE